MAGLPHDVGRDGQRAVVLGAHAAGRRPACSASTSAGKATSGLVAQITKSTWSNTSAMPRWPRCAAARSLAASVEVEHLVGQLEAEGDLDASGRPCSPASGRRAPAAAAPGWPSPTRSRGPAAARRRRRSEAGVARPAPRRPRARAPRPRGGRPRCRASGAMTTVLPAQVVRAEVALPAVDAGQAVGVAAVVAGAHVVPAGHVAHRAGQAADHHGERGDRRCGARAGCGRPCPSSRQAVEPGRDADRPAAVAAGGDRARGRRPPPRPTRPTSRRRCARAATGCG